MLSWIRNFFTIRTHSLDEFIGVLKKKGCSVVRAYPRANSNGVIHTTTNTALGDICHETRYESETDDGRKVLYVQRHLVVFGTTQAILDARKRNIATMKALMITDKVLQTIKEEIPSVRIELIGKDDQVMDENARKLLHREARRFNITA